MGLLHPETLADASIRHPFAVGFRNSLAAVATIGIGGVGYLLRYRELVGNTAWWAWGAVAAAAVLVCFAHAYVGHWIGGRRANSLAVLFLLGCLVALILWMKHAIDAGRGPGDR